MSTQYNQENELIVNIELKFNRITKTEKEKGGYLEMICNPVANAWVSLCLFNINAENNWSKFPRYEIIINYKMFRVPLFPTLPARKHLQK